LQVGEKATVVQRRDKPAKQINEVFIASFLRELRILEFALLVQLRFDLDLERLVEVQLALGLQVVGISGEVFQDLLVNLVLVGQRYVVLCGRVVELFLCVFGSEW
jgi:hypothetical protein